MNGQVDMAAFGATSHAPVRVHVALNIREVWVILLTFLVQAPSDQMPTPIAACHRGAKPGVDAARSPYRTRGRTVCTDRITIYDRREMV